jgi:hypothetical protein
MISVLIALLRRIEQDPPELVAAVCPATVKIDAMSFIPFKISIAVSSGDSI